ncbi:MAG: ComF family protein [Pseudomonadota bacterium]
MEPPVWLSKATQNVAEQVIYWRRHGLASATNLLFPPQCPISGEPVARHGTLAPAAWQQLTLLGAPWCEGCGLPFSDASKGPLCGACAAPSSFSGSLVGPRRLDGFRSAIAYDDEAARAILALKYADRHDGVAAFGALMAKVAHDLQPAEGDVVAIPVPLHRGRLRKRRYNQAGLLASALADHLEIPVEHLVLKRTRPTPSQKGASATKRARNVAGAFAVTDSARVANTHILLVDDVLTTGATLLACARSLRKAGAASVSGLTLARVLRDAP